MMEALLAGESLLPTEREHLEAPRWAEADARRGIPAPEHLARAIAQVDRPSRSG